MVILTYYPYCKGFAMTANPVKKKKNSSQFGLSFALSSILKLVSPGRVDDDKMVG